MPTVKRGVTSGSFILRVMIVAIAYFATGEIGIQLAVYPGHATAIWPPSGIALAAVLVWGTRMWPGIVLGSLSVNVWTGLDASSAANLAGSLVIPATFALGAAAQSLIGRFLICRSGGISNSLDEPADIGRLMFLGGAIACLFNASIAIGCLRLTGRIPPDFAANNWLTWYVGD